MRSTEWWREMPRTWGSAYRHVRQQTQATLQRHSLLHRSTLMMLAPVWVTTPAISMLYQRAPLRIT